MDSRDGIQEQNERSSPSPTQVGPAEIGSETTKKEDTGKLRLKSADPGQELNSNRPWSLPREPDTWISIFITLFVAIYGFSQFQLEIRSQKEAKKSSALGFIERADSAPVRSSLSKLDRLHFGNWPIGLIEDLKNEDNEEIRKEMYRQELLSHFSSSDLEDSFHAIVSFYRNAALCAELELCDPEIMCRFFFEQIQAFRENYWPLLVHPGGHPYSRSRYYKSSRTIDVFAESTCADSFSNYCHELPGSPYCRGTISAVPDDLDAIRK